MPTDSRKSLGRLGEQLAAEPLRAARLADRRAQLPDPLRRARPRRGRRRHARLRRGQDAAGSAAAGRGTACTSASAPGAPDRRASGSTSGAARPFFAHAALRRDRRSWSTTATRSSRSTTSRARSESRPAPRVDHASRSTASRRGASGSRPTSGAACRRSPSSGSPTRRCARRASACARRSSNSGFEFPQRADHGQPRAGLPAQGRARASTCRSRSRSSPPAGSSRPTRSPAARSSASCR